MQARDVMTLNVVSVEPDSSFLHAARLMLQKNISELPVVDGLGKLVGIVTEGDFLRRTELGTQRRRARWIEFLLGPGKLADEYVHSSGRKVQEIMTPVFLLFPKTHRSTRWCSWPQRNSPRNLRLASARMTVTIFNPIDPNQNPIAATRSD